MDPVNRPAGQLALENEPDGRATLRARQTPRSERRKIGKGLRKRVARSSLGDWTPRPTDAIRSIRSTRHTREDSTGWFRFVWDAWSLHRTVSCAVPPA